MRCNPDRIAPMMPELVYDLPAGARRLKQKSAGIAATVVNGDVLMRFIYRLARENSTFIRLLMRHVLETGELPVIRDEQIDYPVKQAAKEIFDALVSTRLLERVDDVVSRNRFLVELGNIDRVVL